MKSNVPAWAVAAIAACAAPAVARAQVGHPPGASPYRFVEARRILALSSGYVWGDLGDARVGPSNGVLAGARFDALFESPVGITFNAFYAALERRIIDPTLPADQRTLGEARQEIVAIDGGLTFIFSGAKSWRGFVPYIGTSIGIAFGREVREDSTSGFRFGTRFLLVPQGGLRLHLSDRLSFDVLARDLMWRLSYPGSYFVVPPAGGDPVLDPNTQKGNEWTHHFTLQASLGWAIGRR